MPALHIFLVIPYKYTGVRGNDFTAHGFLEVSFGKHASGSMAPQRVPLWKSMHIIQTFEGGRARCQPSAPAPCTLHS